MRFSLDNAVARSLASTPARVDTQVARQLGLAAGASAAVGLALAGTGGWKVPAALLAVGALAALGFVRPALFLGVFMLIRPLTALISSQQLVQGIASANADGLTALLLIAVLGVLLANPGKIHAPPGTSPFVLVLVTSALFAVYTFQTLGGRVGGDPVSELTRLAAMFSIYVLSANLFGTVQRARLMFKLVALSAVVPATVGVIQWIQGPPFIPELGMARITSTLGGGPNTLAAYLAPCGLLLITLPRIVPRWVRLPALAVILAALVGTYSREGWLILLLGVVLISWRERPRQVLAVLAGSAVLVFAVPAVHDRVLPSATTSAKTAGGLPSAGTYASLNWRLQNWRLLFTKYTESPIVGFGLGSEPYVSPYSDPYGPPGQGFPSHNSLLQILIEGGVVLLIPWLALLVVVLRSCARMARSTWELRRYAGVVLAVWVTVIVAGLITEDTLATTTLMFIVLALTGSLEGARRTVALQAQRATVR